MNGGFFSRISIQARPLRQTPDILRRIWGDPDLVLLIFAGSAAEFALNRAVDWLFFTGKIPSDPIERFFSTVRFGQEIVFADEETARKTIERINSIHASVERERGSTMPDWAYRDVLYMLIDYSERAYELLYGSLSISEAEEIYTSFRRVGEGLKVSMLPATRAEWRRDRRRHLHRDLAYSEYTALLYKRYRQQLGPWRYLILLQLQALLVPENVRRLLRLNSHKLFPRLIQAYRLLDRLQLRLLARRVLIQPRYWSDLQKLNRRTA